MDKHKLSQVFDWRGYQIKKARRPRKDRPEWAGSFDSIQTFLSVRTQRRARIAYLYWTLGWTAQEVADDLGDTLAVVESAIRRMRRY